MRPDSITAINESPSLLSERQKRATVIVSQILYYAVLAGIVAVALLVLWTLGLGLTVLFS